MTNMIRVCSDGASFFSVLCPKSEVEARICQRHPTMEEGLIYFGSDRGKSVFSTTSIYSSNLPQRIACQPNTVGLNKQTIPVPPKFATMMDSHRFTAAPAQVHPSISPASVANSQYHGLRPSPYSIGLAALITLHNTEDGQLEYKTKQEEEKVSQFLEDTLFFSLKSSKNQAPRQIETLLLDLQQHLNRGSSCNSQVPSQLLHWFRLACTSLDAFLDFCRTVSGTDGEDHASAAHLWKRSVQQQMTQQTSFALLLRVYQQFQQQVDAAAKSLERTAGTTVSIHEPTNNSEPTVDPTDLPLLSSFSSFRVVPPPSADPSWHHLLQNFKAREWVGATDALHEYMDGHADDLGTAGWWKVMLAGTASTLLERREAERVVQQHNGPVMVAEEEEEDDDSEADEGVFPQDYEDIKKKKPSTATERCIETTNQALSLFHGPYRAGDANVYEQAFAALEAGGLYLSDDLTFLLLQHELAVRRGTLASAKHAVMASIQSHPDAHKHAKAIASQVALYHSYSKSSGRFTTSRTSKGMSAPLSLLQQAEIAVRAGNYTLAFPPLLRYLAQHPTSAPAWVLLATLQLEFLDDAAAARQWVQGALPVLRQRGHLAWQAQAYWVLARCTDDMGCLERSIEIWKHLQDAQRLRDGWYYAARHFDRTQQIEKREAAAQQFLRWDRLLRTNKVW